MTLSDCNHLGHVIGIQQIQNFYVVVPLLLCFSLCLRAISKYKPPGLFIWRGDLTEGSLCCGFFGGVGGAYIWRGLFSEFYGFTSNGKRIILIDIRCYLLFKFRIA